MLIINHAPASCSCWRLDGLESSLRDEPLLLRHHQVLRVKRSRVRHLNLDAVGRGPRARHERVPVEVTVAPLPCSRGEGVKAQDSKLGQPPSCG